MGRITYRGLNGRDTLYKYEVLDQDGFVFITA